MGFSEYLSHVDAFIEGSFGSNKWLQVDFHSTSIVLNVATGLLAVWLNV